MKFEPRGFRFRMFDPWVIREARMRPAHVGLYSTIRRNHLLARYRGVRVHGPNMHGRHFHPLSTDVLDARRCGIDPRVLSGRALQRRKT